jgi:Cu/Ag efflux protein CusF
MKTRLSLLLVAVFVLTSSALLASNDRPHEGTIVSVDPDARIIVVQGEKGDQWTLYTTETTKMKDGVILTQLRAGDKIEFEYVDRDGRMYASEIEREHKGDQH